MHLLCHRSLNAPPPSPPHEADTSPRHLTSATARTAYKSTPPRPPEHLTQLLATPRLSPAPIVARRAPQLRRPICPSRLGRGQVLRQRGTVRRFPPPRASSDHRDADALLSWVIGGRIRRVHRQPDATAAGEDALLPPDLASNQPCPDELLHPFPEPFCSLSVPSPCPSRRDTPPVSRRSLAVPSPLFPASKKKENVSG